MKMLVLSGVRRALQLLLGKMVILRLRLGGESVASVTKVVWGQERMAASMVLAGKQIAAGLQRIETLTRGWCLDGGWLVMREEAGGKYSSLMVSMSNVPDKLVEAEEILVLASQGREGYSLLVAVLGMFVSALLQGKEVEREQGADF